MRGRLTVAILSAALAGSLSSAQQSPTPPDNPQISGEDIVVTAKPGPVRKRLNAIGYFTKYCFDSTRLTGKPSVPETDFDWDEADDKLRRTLNITDPSVPIYALDADDDGRQLIVRTEQVTGPWKLPQLRCTMIIVGGTTHQLLVDQVSTMFGGPGTQRHVGERDGVKKLKDWQQWVWTAIPDRKSKNWRVYQRSGAARAGGTWVVVNSRHYYDQYDYVLVDLKIKETTGRPISILTFDYTHVP